MIQEILSRARHFTKREAQYLFFAVNLLDCITTRTFLHYHLAGEANPLMRSVQITGGFTFFVVFKMGLALIACRYLRREPLLLASVLLSLVVLWNCLVISGVL